MRVTLGSCLYDHDFPFKGDAKRIIELRQQGISWSKIGEEFDKSSSGARSYFTKLTGSKEYKMKGDDLVKAMRREGAFEPGISSKGVVKKVAKKEASDDIGEVVVREQTTSVGGNTVVRQKVSSTGPAETELQKLERQRVGHLWEVKKKASKEFGDDFESIVMRLRAEGASTKDLSKLMFRSEDDIRSILEKITKPRKPSASISKPRKPKPKPTKSDLPKGPGGDHPPPPGRIETDGYAGRWGNNDYPILSDDAMRSMRAEFTEEEIEALQMYTTGTYEFINGMLRFGEIEELEFSVDEIMDLIKDIRSAMNKSTIDRSITVSRGMDVNGFGLGPVDDLSSLTGKVFQDKGFMSTTTDINGGVFTGDVRLVVRCPPGTKGTYLEGISDEVGEYEFLLGDSQSMMIDKVVKGSGPKGETTVYATVLV